METPFQIRYCSLGFHCDIGRAELSTRHASRKGPGRRAHVEASWDIRSTRHLNSKVKLKDFDLSTLRNQETLTMTWLVSPLVTGGTALSACAGRFRHADAMDVVITTSGVVLNLFSLLDSGQLTCVSRQPVFCNVKDVEVVQQETLNPVSEKHRNNCRTVKGARCIDSQKHCCLQGERWYLQVTSHVAGLQRISMACTNAARSERVYVQLAWLARVMYCKA